MQSRHRPARADATDAVVMSVLMRLVLIALFAAEFR
jgi:hypothetical protein